MVTGVCVGSWERFAANVIPHTAGPIVALSGQDSIARAYNAILDAAYVEWGDVTVVLQHDDLEITDPDFEAKLTAAAADDVAVIGVAGARGVTDLAWWNYDTVGHQHTDAGLIDFGPRTGDVDALEGSLLAFTPWAVKHLRFDPLPGFHGYDVLIAKKAIAAGKRAVVADIDTHHHSRPGFKSPESEAGWHHANEYLREKVHYATA